MISYIYDFLYSVTICISHIISVTIWRKVCLGLERALFENFPNFLCGIEKHPYPRFIYLFLIYLRGVYGDLNGPYIYVTLWKLCLNIIYSGRNIIYLCVSIYTHIDTYIYKRYIHIWKCIYKHFQALYICVEYIKK